jgi:hypothetical protein
MERLTHEELYRAFRQLDREKGELERAFEEMERLKDGATHAADRFEKLARQRQQEIDRLITQAGGVTRDTVGILAQVEGRASEFFCPSRPHEQPHAHEVVGDLAALAADAIRCLGSEPSHSPDYWTGYGRGRGNVGLVDGGEVHPVRRSTVTLGEPRMSSGGDAGRGFAGGLGRLG